MFGANKAPFGQATSTFGGFNTSAAASPFGQSAFGKPPATAAGFGSFGQATPQQGGGLFGQPQAAQPATGLFGQPQTSQQGFGQPQTSQQGFGFGQNTSGGLFGNPQAGSTLFGQSAPAVQPFGAKPPGFGFGGTSTAPVGGLFGSPASSGGGLFGGQSTMPQTGGSGLFGANTGFGVNTAAQTGTCIKYAPIAGTDAMVKNGHTQNINTLHHCITCMKEYEAKSLEELRLEDYAANRKGGAAGGFGQPGGQAPAGGLFNSPQDKPLFGQANTAFGQPSTSTPGGLFGKPATTAFGAQPAAGTGFSFGANTAQQSTPLFGAAKPFSTPGVGMFGAPAAQTQPTPFSTQPSQGFGAFGAPQQQTNSLFGAKPADAPAFGMPQTTSAGGFGMFGAPAGQQNTGGLFGAKPAATPFGQAAPAFGAPNTGFGAPQANTTGGLFGNTAFGAKPATTGAPAFGGFNTTPATNATLGGGLNMSGGGMFGQKPAGGGLFGGTGAQTTGGGLFGGTGNTLQLGGLGTNLGGGTGNFSSFGMGTGGSLGGNLSLNMTNNQLGGNTSLGMNNTSANQSGMSVHEQLIALTAANPFGHSALLKDLVPSPDKADEIFKPTNVLAQKAVLDSDKFKVSNGVTRLRVMPFTAFKPVSKKFLFDGLEEDDPSIKETLSLKPSVKRLVLRPKQPQSRDAAQSVCSPGNDDAEISASSFNVNGNADNERDSRRNSESFEVSRRSDEGSTPRGDTSHITQRRVGLSDPRGSSLRSPLQSSSGGNTSDDADHRASSWLTTKPLDKWQSSPSDQMAGSSTAPLDNTVAQLLPRGRLYPDLDCVEDESQEERDKENLSPHPTGIKLNRPGYYTIPSMDDLINHMRTDGTCIVPQFTIGRRGYGNAFFDCEMDVAGLDLDEIVHIMNKEIVVYPNEDSKPEVGCGLNRKAQVTLDKVWPIDKALRVPITDPQRLATMDYEAVLRRACDKSNTKFIEYRPQTGSWVFKVQHFSKYGLTESDEEEEFHKGVAVRPDALKPDGVLAPHGAKATSLAGQKMTGISEMGRGLGGSLLPGGLVSSGFQQHMLNMDEQSMDGDGSSSKRMDTHSKGGFAMDTSEENSVDTLVLHPDNQSSIFGSKDVTTPNSRMQMDIRSSHTLQLMKASFYNMDNDVDDMQSVTDHLVPQALSIASGSLPAPAETMSLMNDTVIPNVCTDPFLQSGVKMKSPIIKPQTVILKYHKRILPFKKTIAGRLDAGCYSDLAIANARLFRVGWGVGSQLTSLATLDSVADIPLARDLSSLSDYLAGRGDTDSSGVVTQRLRIAGGGAPTDIDITFKETVERHLEIMLSHSRMVSESDAQCPLFVPDADSHLVAAEKHLQEAARLSTLIRDSDGIGISPLYWKQVWSLCIALWGDHGDPDEDPNEPSGNRLLAEHAAFSEWLETCNAEEVHLKETAEERDSVDGIVALLAGNRLLDACRLAQKEKNYLLAAILTQIKGDDSIRSLAYNQCVSFLQTCAQSHISSRVMGVLALLSGRARLALNGGQSLHACRGLTWVGALALHYWYICDPVATVSDALRAFEASFWEDCRPPLADTCLSDQADDDISDQDRERDIRVASDRDQQVSRVALPVPRHMRDELRLEDSRKRILDLRYQLMSLRTSKWKSLDSVLNPASHTQDPLDYRLSWLLQQFLEGRGYSHWSANGLACVTTGFAAQLEAHGLWHWAVFVLLHIKDDRMRAYAVKEMILRHAGGSENTSAGDLLCRLGVPEKWIHLAEAQKAKYLNDPENEARHLTLAEQWTEAHCVILDKLAPTYVLNENGDSLRRMLEPLVPPGDQGLIPNWISGGHLYLEFLDIWEELKSLVGLDWDDFSYRCESLKPRIAAACTAITNLPSPTLKHTVARWEVAARLAQVGCAVVGHPDTGLVARSSMGPLLSIIDTLDLPPDYTKLLLDKITDSFTESDTNCLEESRSIISVNH